MKLSIWYDKQHVYLDLSAEDTEKLWISLSLEDEGLSQKEKEERIQKKFDELINNPEYNSWRQLRRHRGYSKAMPNDDEDVSECDFSEPLMSEVADPNIFLQDEIQRDEWLEYESVCSWVRDALASKPLWAEAFIAVRLDGMAVKDFAESVGIKDPDIISKYLARAEKKLRKVYSERQI